MNYKGFLKTKYIVVLLTFCMVVGLVTPVYATETPTNPPTSGSGSSSTNERWAPEKLRRYGITYKEFVEKNGEPSPGHILVGTYLIDIVPTEEMLKNGDQAVTGAIYQAAQTSKLTYSQNVEFYKSELSGGDWRDIAGSDSLKDITVNDSKIVQDYEMNEMLITVYVKGGESENTKPNPDGDPVDADRINPFLVPSPYNLDEMPEMADLLKMTTDGSLSHSDDVSQYTKQPSDYPKVAEDQSKRFMSERLKYMFGHDEDTDTIKLHENDGLHAAPLYNFLAENVGWESNKSIEKYLDEAEKNGTYSLDPLMELTADRDHRDIYTFGEDGTLHSAFRNTYHFSDTRDEVTEPMDKAVVNLWDVYLEYKDAAKAAGEEEDSFEAPADTLTNKDKYGFLYQTISYADSVRRGEAYYNLAVNEDFHGGTGSVLSNIKQMNEDGTSKIGRNIHNAPYFVPEERRRTGIPVPFLNDDDNNNSTTLGGFAKNEALASAIDLAIENARNKYVDYSQFTFVKGSTAISQYIYDNEMLLVEKTKKDDEVDKLIEGLIYVNNIKDSKVKHGTKEAALIYQASTTDTPAKTGLVGTQNRLFAGYIAQGLPANYNVIGSKEEDIRALLLSQQTSGKNSEKAMEKLIDAYILRVTDVSGRTELLTTQLAWVRTQKKKIQDTDYAPYAEEIRNDYETYLINKMKELDIDVPGDDSEGDAIDFDGSIKKAYEDNDPKLAGEIEKLKDQYSRNPTPTPPGYTPSIDIDPHTGLPYIKNTKKDDSNGPDTGNGSGGSNGSGSSGTGDKNSSNGTGTGGSSGNNGGNGDGADGNGNGSNGLGNNDTGGNGLGGNGSGGTSGLPVPNGDMLDNLLAILGKSWDELDPQAKAELVCALNQFGRENKNNDALNLARNLLSQIMLDRNPLVYTKYSSASDTEYVSLGAIDRARIYTRFRQVREGLEITMTRMDLGLTFVFQNGSATVKMLNGEKSELLAPLVSQGDRYMNRGDNLRQSYLDEEDAQSKLNCRAEYIEDSLYAVCVTYSMEPHIKELVETLTDLYKYQ